MTKRIYRAISMSCMTVLVACLVLILGVLYSHYSDLQMKQLQQETVLAAQGVEDDGMDYLENLEVSNLRITWIASDGTVLFDNQSGTETMENHLERPEVKQALQTGSGESKRYSSTMMQQSFYQAQLLEDGTVLRLSVAQKTVLALVFAMVQPLLMIIAIALLLSIIVAIQLAKKITKPLNELNLEQPLENKDYDEISPLLRRIDLQQKQLAIQKKDLNRKQSELDTVVRAMREGMLQLGQRGDILSINQAAMDLLETDESCIGKNLLTINRNPVLQEAVGEARTGHDYNPCKAMIHGRTYEINARPVVDGGIYNSDDDFFCVTILFVDITEREQAEEMRREFTANVSHELKTPLQSISGYSELMKCGMVKQEDMIPFAGKIYNESQRMIQLVEDTINLSHLDEGAGSMEREQLDLHALSEQVLEDLEPAASAKQVTLKLEGERAELRGIRQLLEQLIRNLCDNAIKYNREGGTVTVKTEKTEDGGTVKLTVSDTGIGIPCEHLSRIFERFYRVDKSHSREIGGTGLGLSIVKHAALVHDGRVNVSSEVGKGTTFTVLFPLQS